ncbi:Na/Pi cotransporter family protein [Tropicimonas sp. IMCC34043]|uniref:Na/Pi cotransporter family protein n=1 Tax=Tropicimonas sp. IMCC34043 TaxID=2248760 RepID=UPI000E286255|nr:Na/Pi cotransporter family protein [Tropicimonas sp. IMCC34043]
MTGLGPRRLVPGVCGVAALLAAAVLATGAAAQGAGAGTLPVWTMLRGLLGGLALFLFGLDQMADALRAAAGGRMRQLLTRVTTNRVTGALAGAVVTAIIQSSSVTTVLVVGFVTAGLMSVAQSAGVIIGANVGSTVTAQIVAFNVDQAALFMIAGGFALRLMSRRDAPRQIGSMVLGLGLIFYGMQLMSEGMEPLRSYAPFTDAMAGMRRPLPAILIAAAFTALIQSSAATMGIVIAMAGGGLIGLDTGIALIFGANIGTCVTALLAAVGRSPVALRAATIHVLFNLAGVALWLAFIPELAALTRAVSPHVPGLTGPAARMLELPRQIANAHTIFNLANALLALPLANALVWVAFRLVPDRPDPADAAGRPKYLDPMLLATPAMALMAARHELERMAEIAQQGFDTAIEVLLTEGRDPARVVHPAMAGLRALHRAVLTYLAELGRGDLSAEDSADLGRQVAISHNLTRIAEIIESDLVPAVIRARDGGPSKATADRGQAMAATVSTALGDLREALTAPESGRDAAVWQLKPIVDQAVEDTLAAETRWLAGLGHRLRDDEIAQMQAEVAVVEAIKRVYSQARRAARECVAHPPE